MLLIIRCSHCSAGCSFPVVRACAGLLFQEAQSLLPDISVADMACFLTIAVCPSQWEDTAPNGDGAIKAVLGHGVDWGLSFPM